MKPYTIITILLMMGALFPSPPTASAQAVRLPVNRALQAWLAPMSGMAENSPAAAWHNPLLPVARFYQKVGFQPVWTAPEGLLPQGNVLLQAMTNAFEVGLYSDDYPLAYLETLPVQGFSFSDVRPPPELEPYIQLDVILTEGMLRYAQHLSQGRVMPETLSRQWLARRRPASRDIPAELAEALSVNRLESYIESLHPQGHAYQGLRKALQQYTQIKASGGWPSITPGPTLRPGDQGRRVETLKQRLRITDDLPIALPTGYSAYGDMAAAAVKRFQHRHGLRVDGLVGKHTQAELNVSVDERITQLQLNMERWRWFPDSLGNRYLMVNIPAFELSVVEAHTRIDNMRVIVGKKRRQTPIMSGRMTYLELNPFWNIPQKIARKDILPKVIDDPAYLARQGIKVFDSWDRLAQELDPANIAWEKISARYFPYRLRQDPSDLNALGQVKFMFPNNHSVYIHDTPGKALFNRQERSLSSGCVRVEAPLALARYLLSQQGWDRTRLETAIAQGQRQAVVLDNPIPVHLVYFTAWVDAGGRVNFREDIYARDRRLRFALRNRHSEQVFCSNAVEKNPLLAVGTAPTSSPLLTAEASGRVAVTLIEPTGEMADNPMTGI